MEEIGDEKLEVEVQVDSRPTLVDEEETVFCTPTIVVNGGYGIKHTQIMKRALRPMTEHDVFVKIFYCGINFADIYCTTGTFFQKPFPFSLGIEASGVVLKVGSKVTRVTTGDLVSVYHPNGGMLAKHAVVQEKYVFLYNKRDVILQQGNIMEHLIAAAAIPTAYLTANALIKIIGHISDFLFDYYSRDAQNWLFHGCGGGVGLAFAVLANNFKQSDLKKAMRQIKLLGTCSEHKMNSELVKNSLYECFAYKEWDKNVSKKYGGVDVIIDTIGGTNINRSVDVLRPNGVLFSIGASSALNNRPTMVSCSDESSNDKSCALNQTEVVMKNLGYYGVNLQTEIENNPEILKRVMESITREIFQKPALANIDKVYSFQDSVVALNRLLTRNNVGKVVIETEKGLDEWLRNASESTKKQCCLGFTVHCKKS